MDRASPSLDSLVALELRVLEGPQAGARTALVAGAACQLATGAVGQAEAADIVLRDELASAARVRITADLSQGLVEVLHGQATLGEQVLTAGMQAAWTMRAPLRIGRSCIAFGIASIGDWRVDAARADAPGTPASTGDTAAAENEAPKPAPLRRRAEFWLATTGAAILLACGGAMAMAHLAAAPDKPAAIGAAPLVEALRHSEFPTLQASERADGRVELRGRLDTMAQRNRLDAWLGEQHLTPTVDVLVDELIARDVTETFRVNGVAVQVRTVGAGRIVAEASDRDAQHLARAEDVVRRDVRNLAQLTVHNTAVPLPPPSPPVVDDPGKRIASVVPGELAYVVTVDGARYFVGSLLPSGYRITKVAAQRVTVERDGQQSTLNF